MPNRAIVNPNNNGWRELAEQIISAVAHGVRAGQALRERMAEINQYGEDIRQQLFRHLERFVTPDPQYIELVHEQSRNYEIGPDAADRARIARITPERTGSQYNLRNTPQRQTRREIMSAEPPQNVQREGGQTASGSEETPVDPNPPTYGLQETHTTILPITVYFSVGNVSHGTPAFFKVKMTSINGIIPTIPVGATGAFSPLIPFIHNKAWTGTTSAPTDYPSRTFPTTLTATPDLYWKKYWNKLYEVYHVKACHWKLTAANMTGSSDRRTGITIGSTYQAYSSSYGAQIPSNFSLTESYAWKDVNYKTVYSANNAAEHPDTITLSDSYYPGKAKRNVRNDEDVKTWTQKSTSPALNEELVFMFWKSGMTSEDNNHHKLNCQLELKYVVQYKDLNVNIRYPTYLQTPFETEFPTDLFGTTGSGP